MSDDASASAAAHPPSAAKAPKEKKDKATRLKEKELLHQQAVSSRPPPSCGSFSLGAPPLHSLSHPLRVVDPTALRCLSLKAARPVLWIENGGLNEAGQITSYPIPLSSLLCTTVSLHCPAVQQLH